VLHCDQVCISTLLPFTRYSAPKCLTTDQCKSSMRMRDITWPVPLCKIFVHILISHPTLPIHYDTFIKLRKFAKSWPKLGANFGGLGRLGVRGFKKLRCLLQKAHSRQPVCQSQPIARTLQARSNLCVLVVQLADLEFRVVHVALIVGLHLFD